MKLPLAVLITCLFLASYEIKAEDIFQDGGKLLEKQESDELKKKDSAEQEEQSIGNGETLIENHEQNVMDGGTLLIDKGDREDDESLDFLGEQSDINNLGLDCNFQQGFCGWHQSSADQFDWTRNRGGTSSSSTGPSVDHTTGTISGYYIYIETSSPRRLNDAARLVSPQLPSTNGICLSFWYHMFGDTINRLSVYTNAVRVWTMTGNQGNRWFKATVRISRRVPFNITFAGFRGSSFTGDIALDDISVTSSCRNPTPRVNVTIAPSPIVTATITFFSPTPANSSTIPTNPRVQPAPVRLVNGGAPNRGRVEIFHNGVWGTICDDGWDLNDANVVCRQLGFSPATSAPCCSRLGRGSGQIWMDEVRCRGSERYLSQCPFNGFGRHDCSHREDAGVVCGGVIPSPVITASPRRSPTPSSLVFPTSSVVCRNLVCYNGGTPFCSGGRTFCICRRGFTGRQCLTAFCRQGIYCYNGGVPRCINGRPNCRCRPGYTGRQCQYLICHRLYCRNGGTRFCINRWPYAYCRCRPGFSGRWCERAVCRFLNCYNGGRRFCLRGISYCRCRPGYYGRQCQFRFRTTNRPFTTRRPRHILRLLLKMIKGFSKILDAIADVIKAGISRRGARIYKRQITTMMDQVESHVNVINELSDPEVVNIRTDVEQIRKRADGLLKQLDELPEKEEE